MSVDFVGRLVDRVRGDNPALRPIVGPWAGTSREPLETVEDFVEVQRPHVPDAGAGEAFTAQAVRAPSTTHAPTLVANVRREQRGVDDAPAQAPGAPGVVERTIAAPLVRAVAAARSPAEPAGAETSSDTQAAAVPPLATAPSSSVAERATATRSTARGPAAPSRPETGSDAQVVRVHIGRIDVRAATPPPPAPRRPAEPLPSVALGRYLDERGRRR